MNWFRFLLVSGILLSACQSSTTADQKTSAAKVPASAFWTPPPPGTLVAADSMRILEDRLNHFYFAVQLIRGKDRVGSGPEGAYVIRAHFGPNKAESQLVMPRGGGRLKPLLRASADGGYSYVIGFIPGPELGGDGRFHEYYQVRASKGSIEIRALKGYVFE